MTFKVYLKQNIEANSIIVSTYYSNELIYNSKYNHVICILLMMMTIT